MTLPPLIPRKVFFGNPDKWKVRLSPDGEHLSYTTSLVVVLTHLGNRPAPSDSHTVTAVATEKDMERAIYREGAAARLRASTRILAGQAGTEEYVSRTLAYIAQEYPNTIAARDIAASHEKQGDER